MMRTIYEVDDKPTALRYPRGSALGLDVLNDLFEYGLDEYPARGKALPLGKGRVVRGAREDVSSRVAILSLGTRLAESVLAARAIEGAHADVGVTVAEILSVSLCFSLFLSLSLSLLSLSFSLFLSLSLPFSRRRVRGVSSLSADGVVCPPPRRWRMPDG